MAQYGDHAEQQEGAGDDEQLELLEGYETSNQDPGGNGSQWTK